MFNYVKFVATKKNDSSFFLPLSFAAVFGSEIPDPQTIFVMFMSVFRIHVNLVPANPDLHNRTSNLFLILAYKHN
jgi:hypothetical protein